MAHLRRFAAAAAPHSSRPRPRPRPRRRRTGRPPGRHQQGALRAGGQLTCALVGIAIGVLCSRLVFKRQGYALVAALVLMAGALFVKGAPPVNRLFTLMSTTPEATKLLAPAGAMLAVSATVRAGFTAATHFVAGRRE
ncbi:hypothetical protein [Streptomyces griseorubiginosus]|uniref:hypothetical protein n=1 Tax=Streptomyces griseorubiginosus TaxID=67304 RepID=UPI003663DBB6